MNLDSLIDSVGSSQPTQPQTQPSIQVPQQNSLDSLISTTQTAQTAHTEDTTRVDIIPSTQTLDQQRGVDEKVQQYTAEQQAQARQEGIAGTLPPTTEQETLDANPISDPLTATLFGAAGEGAIRGISAIAEKVRWPKHIKKIFDSMDANEYEAQQNLYKFMEDNGILRTDALVEGSGGSDLGQFLKGNNLFATRDAFDSQEILANKYIEMSNKILKDLKAKNIDVKEGDWRAVKDAEDIVAKNVQQLRKSYKDIEQQYYGKVEEIAKRNNDTYKVSDFSTNLEKDLTEQGIPPEAVNTVKTILSRFSKPFKDETNKLGALNKNRAKVLVEMKKLKAKQKSAIANGKDAEAVKLEEQMGKVRDQLKAIDEDRNSLRDTRYMSVQDILNTTKLINRKIYKPGGAISSKDADELRGLQIAKNKLEEFLSTNVKDPELQKALGEARSITRKRAQLFGAKDTGGEKLALAKMLETGDYGSITEFLTGKNAKENILYVRDVFGKNSEAYQTSLHKYITNKIGIDPNKLQSILDQRKATGVLNKTDIQKAATKISTLDNQDLAMIENSLGKQAKLDMIALKKLTTNFADLENAAEKYGRGITSGKRQYIFSADNPFGMLGRTMKVLKDAVGYKMAKTAEQVIYNQPKFRTLTGALTGETVYLANTKPEDLTIQGVLLSAIGGSVGGYYGGKVARSVLESDANKIARYLKEGKGKPSVDVLKSMGRIEDALGGSKPKTIRDVVTQDSTIEPLIKDKIHEVLDDGTIVLSYGGRNAAKVRELPDKIVFDNTSFQKGSGVGQKFYQDMFDLAEKSGKPVVPEGPLLDRAGYRYPIAIMKYYQKNGKLPNAYITSEKPVTMDRLVLEAKGIEADLKRGDKLFMGQDTKKLVESIAGLTGTASIASETDKPNGQISAKDNLQTPRDYASWGMRNYDEAQVLYSKIKAHPELAREAYNYGTQLMDVHKWMQQAKGKSLEKVIQDKVGEKPPKKFIELYNTLYEPTE